MKKIFFVSVLAALSLQAFAEDSLSTTDALTKVVAPRSYVGVNPDTNEACSVSIRRSGDSVTISGVQGRVRATVTITDEDSYHWQPGQRLFRAGVRSEDRFGDVTDGSFMTRMTDVRSQFMAVETRVFHQNSRQETNNVVACEVSI
ncbi:MAG: hypothetical protein AB7I27_15330 [Bacteriovoracaceae bacterium]